MTDQPARSLLITGPPGCGKTTIICRLIERLDGLRLAGFYTRELREQGQRVSFEAEDLIETSFSDLILASKDPGTS